MLPLLSRIADLSTDYTTSSGCSVNGQPASCSAAGGVLAGIFGVLFFVIYLPLIILMIASMWKLFTKAGKPGWASIVPFYNIYVLLEIVGRPGWWLVLFLIPFVNFVVSIILALDTAKAYGKDAGFAILLIFLPFIGYPVLAFGKSKYVGPLAGGNSANASSSGSQDGPVPGPQPPVSSEPPAAQTPPAATPPTNPVQ